MRIVSGPNVAVAVVSRQTGAPLAGVTVTVNQTVYTDQELTAAATVFTTNGSGVISFYAAPGSYTFTTSSTVAAAIEPVEVLGGEEGIATAGLIGKLSATYVTVVAHGATGSTARPSGAVAVLWVGSATPANAVTDDEWLDKSVTPAVLRRYNGASFDALGGSSGGGSGFAVNPSTDGTSMTLTYVTPYQWGISSAGCPYFDSTAVTTGDEAIFTVGSDGSVALIRL